MTEQELIEQLKWQCLNYQPEKFAATVAQLLKTAKENQRERDAKVCENTVDFEIPSEIQRIGCEMCAKAVRSTPLSEGERA